MREGGGSGKFRLISCAIVQGGFVSEFAAASITRAGAIYENPESPELSSKSK